jgi:hypothetical protein
MIGWSLSHKIPPPTGRIATSTASPFQVLGDDLEPPSIPTRQRIGVRDNLTKRG